MLVDSNPIRSLTALPKMARRAFSIVELLTVVFIVTILSALLLGISQKLVAIGQNGKCINNLKQIYAASVSFSQDNEGRLPQHYFEWATEIAASSNGFTGGGIAQYLYPERTNWDTKKDYRGTVFQDPGARNAWIKYPIYPNTTIDLYLGGTYNGIPDPKKSVHYAHNNDIGTGIRPLRFVEIPRPSKFFMYVCGSDWNQASDAINGTGPGLPDSIAPRHNGAFNMIFADGHVDGMKVTLKDPALTNVIYWQRGQ